jgi:hypothetical protein
MGKASVPYAKNTIRRSLFEILDPQPTTAQEARLWDHFGSACAYCDRALTRGTKQAHLDHLVPSSEGGRNHIGNRVLACATCNEHEKRELPWEPFLQSKCETADVFAARRARIVAWQAQFTADDLHFPPAVVAAINEAAVRACGAYDSAVKEIRALRDELP